MARVKLAARLLLAYLAFLTAARSLKYLSGDLVHFDPLFREKYAANFAIIFLHGAAAISALAIGPIQFFSPARRRWPRAHRILGRVYMLAILIGGITGFYMGLIAYGGPAAQTAFCLMAFLWLATGWKGLRLARAGRIPEHRDFMIRNYALTFGAVTLRLYLNVLQTLGFEFENIYAATAWAAWVPNLIFAELLIRRRGNLRAENSLMNGRTIAPLLLLIALSCVSARAQKQPPPAAPANIVVFIGDDVGALDSGAFGNEAVQTPNLDALAKSGVRCARGFLTSPQCSPSRISMLTGKYPHATGAEDLHTPLPEGERFVTSYLKEAGYFTGHMRKTHYGPNGEKQFDWYSRDTGDMKKFLDAAGDKPFFLWVGFIDAHRPYEPGAFEPAHDPGKVKVPPYLADTPETRRDLALYYDEVARMDAEIGRMLAEIKARGAEKRTLVVYTNDNGAPFPRAKGALYDSGIQSPLIFSWPGTLPEGKTFEGLASTIDLAPTFLEIAGLPSPAKDMQGQSMLAALRDPENAAGREAVYSERNWHNCDEHMRAIRTDRYKLIQNSYLDLNFGTPLDVGESPSFQALAALREAGKLPPEQGQIFAKPRPKLELYDVQNDPHELKNLADTAEHRNAQYELEYALEIWRERTRDHDAAYRRRADNSDRMTGKRITEGVPPMTDPVPPQAAPGR